VRRRGACWAAAGGARQHSAPRQGACERGPRAALAAAGEPGRGAAAGPAGRRGRWGGPHGGRPRRGRGRQPGGGPGGRPRCAAARRQKAARLQQPGRGSTQRVAAREQRIPAWWLPRGARRRGQPSAEAHPAAGPREAAAGAAAAAGRARRARDCDGGAHSQPLSQTGVQCGPGMHVLVGRAPAHEPAQRREECTGCSPDSRRRRALRCKHLPRRACTPGRRLHRAHAPTLRSGRSNQTLI